MPPSPSESGNAVAPALASRAASTPLAAALPGWNGLVIEPNPSRCPMTMVETSAMACSSSVADRSSSSAAAAAAPKTPQVPVMCQPRS